MTARHRPPAGCPLTTRQFEVFALIARVGLQTTAIARRLHLSVSTIRSHLHNTYRKLDVVNAAQALTVCFNAGWLDPTSAQFADPTQYEDRDVTPQQRVYLWAYDHHLATASDDQTGLDDAKRRTDAALVACNATGRSVASRDWMDRLIIDLILVGER